LADGNFYAAKGYSLSWDSNASAAARRYNYWFGKEDGKIKLQYAGLVNGSMAYEYKKSANQVPAGKHWFVGVMSSKSDIKLYVDGT